MTSINARSAKITLCFVAAYLILGLLFFPGWWYNTFSYYSLIHFLRYCFIEFLPTNLFFLISVWALIKIYRKTSAGGSAQVAWVNKYIDRWSTFFVIFLLLSISAARVYLGGKSDYAPKEAVAESVNSQDSPNRIVITPPIELVYVNRVRVNDAFEQLLGEIQLKEQKISHKGTGEVEGSGNIGPVSTRGKMTGEAESSATYGPIDATQPKKILKIIDTLSGRGAIVLVRSVEYQSADLNEFDSAAKILTTKHSISLPEAQVDERRRVLIEENVSQAAPDEFVVGGWALIDGEFKLRRKDKSITLEFDYVPSLPGRVVFTCTENAQDFSVPALSTIKELNMKVFGKIFAVQNNLNRTQYMLSCYSAFR